MGYAVDLLFATGSVRIATYEIAAKTESEATVEAERWLHSAQSIARHAGTPMPTGYSLVCDGVVIATKQFAPGNDNDTQPATGEAPFL